MYCVTIYSSWHANQLAWGLKASFSQRSRKVSHQPWIHRLNWKSCFLLPHAVKNTHIYFNPGSCDVTTNLSPAQSELSVWLGSAGQTLPKLMHKLLFRTATHITVIKDSVFPIVGSGLCPLPAGLNTAGPDEPPSPLSSIQQTNSGYCHRRPPSFILFLNHRSNHRFMTIELNRCWHLWITSGGTTSHFAADDGMKNMMSLKTWFGRVSKPVNVI